MDVDVTERKSGFLKAFSNSVRGIDTSRQLALGIALGAMIGFMPKDNLLIAGLLVVLIISGSNLLTGAVACLAASLAAPLLEPIFHQAGKTVLETDFVSTLLGRFFELPLAAWTNLDNSTVLGSLLIGMAVIVPLYFVSFGILSRYRASIRKLFAQSALVNWIVGYSNQELLDT